MKRIVLLVLFFGFKALAFEFPEQLLDKAPVNFPILKNSNLVPPLSMPANFAAMVQFIQRQCEAKYSVQLRKGVSKAVTDLKSKLATDELRITCSVPLLAAYLDSAGRDLQALSKVGKKSGDVPTTLAAGGLAVLDLEAIAKVPDRAAIMLVALRTLSINWRVITDTARGWWGPNDKFALGIAGELSPWLTEFSSFSAVARFQRQLPCSTDTGDADCIEISRRVSRVLQNTILRVNNDPTVKEFLEKPVDQLVSGVLPQLGKIRALDVLIGGALNDDLGFALPWTTNKVGVTVAERWASTATILETVIPSLGQEFPSLPSIDLEVAQPDIVAQLIKAAQSEPNAPADGDWVSARAIMYGFQAAYGSGTALATPGLLQRFLSLKRFTDLQTIAKIYRIDSCTACLSSVSTTENKYIDKLIVEIRDMYSDIDALIHAKP